MKQITKWLTSLLAVLILVANFNVNVLAQDTIKIGILQTVEHDALNAVREGFQEQINQSSLKDRVEWDVQNANGDLTTLQSMAEKLARDNDILLAIATPAAQALANIETEKPIFIAAVADPVKAGVAESLESSGRNVTGTSNMSPTAEQAELLVRNFPEAKTVGLIYNSSEVNSQVQVERAQKAFDELGINLELATVASTNEIGQVMESLVKNVDSVFLVTDNTIDSAISLVGDIAKKAGLPVVGSADTTIKANGLMTLSYPYLEYGKQTANMVVKMLDEGLAPKDMPIELAKEWQLFVNEDYAKVIGVDPTGIK